LAEYDLLSLAETGEGIHFVEAEDKFPAFGITKATQIKAPYRTILPEKLTEFSILTDIRPDTRTGGYIFTVVNPLDTIIQLGVRVSPVTPDDKWNVSLIYTDPNTYRGNSILANFEVPYSTRKWQKYAFKVLKDEIIFYNNCQETATEKVTKSPAEMVFDSASTLYIGQGGDILKGKFEVSTK
jgi:hypothetical protein